MLQRQRRQLSTLPGFAAGVVLTVPPFPYAYGYDTLSKGMPVCMADGSPAYEQPFLHLAEVALCGHQLVTSGATGYVGVATGTGATPAKANRAALRGAEAVVVPNLRYRTDIGHRVENGHWQRLQQLGWLTG
jgi:phosphoribosylamine--glycine ligase